ncbi:hypothetical protein CC80DRAFT_493560 [Byssothecium circinans]|uniref:Pentacotripeptide-repeat region of PRORP domain-containing protein n=1 Tax=Byssothecium circinans TaxID=147558 RepID=A0A6A5TQ17_9PLEO|nr:hypothetical protein CC80DRAFT_493560 [Byssothecium circinans]
MIRSYVCRQCRDQLRQRIVTPRNPQWHPRATFISLRNAQPPPESQPQPSPEESSNAEKAQNESHYGQEEPPIIYVRRDYEPSGRYTRRGQPQEQEDALSGNAEPEIRYSQAPTPGDHTPAVALQDLLNKKDPASTNKAWKLFLQEYPSRDSSAFTNPAFQDIPILTGNKIFERLAKSMMIAFCNGTKMEARPTEVLFKLEQLGLARYEPWRNAFGYMTDQILWAVLSPNQEKLSAEALTQELISVWRLFFQCRGVASQPPDSISAEWRNVPDVTSWIGRHEEAKFGQRLLQYHPGAPSGAELQFSAVTLFNLFDDVNQGIFKVSDSLRQDAAPLLRLITYCLARSNADIVLNHTERSPYFMSLPKNFQAAVVDQLRSAPHQAMSVVLKHRNEQAKLAEFDGTSTVTSLEHTSTSAPESQPPFPSPSQESSELEDMESFYRKLISRAVLSESHAGSLQKLWEEAQIVFKKSEVGTIPPLVYNDFLSGFMVLLQSEKTIEVWNHMVASGIKPEIRTWVALVDGCSKARDLDGLQAVWERMLKAGVEPDEYAWTAYIHGLISLRQINLGFKAMDQMGKKWLAAVKEAQTPVRRLKGGRKLPHNVKGAKDVNHIARPTIVTVNAAIAAFVEIPKLRFDEKLRSVHKVLEWAGHFNIKPDSYTYNTLIKLYIMGNDHATAFRLLRQMEQDGIEGDAATHNMLISAAFNNQKFDNLSESEQANRIITLLDQLEAGGLKLNTHLYSNAIDRLLKKYGNMEAVTVVMRHMTARNITVSPQIYTSLITHCFQQTPPDIPAVDAIVAQIFGPPQAHVDTYLFNRIVERYGIHGQVDQMMSVLTRMSRHGKLPSWFTLKAVIKALAGANDWERARALVRDVQLQEGVAKGGVTGGTNGQKDFFRWVVRLGIELDQELAGDVLKRVPEGMSRRSEDSQVDYDAEALEQRQDTTAPGFEEGGLGNAMSDAQDFYAKNENVVDELDDEFVNGEHAGYLNNEPEVERQVWRPAARG